MEQNTADDRLTIRDFWTHFFLDASPYTGVLVSANCFFSKLLGQFSEQTAVTWLQQCDVRSTYAFTSHFSYQSNDYITGENHYSHTSVTEQDHYLSDRFHVLVPQIVSQYSQSFIDQLRCIHFLGMAGNEAIMLYPSQTRRLMLERVTRIAGEIRDIPAGFGDFRFNAPRSGNLQVLLSAYTRKVSELLSSVDDSSICNLVSFAQYYFALLHPFYERCGRTSEDLMYLLFEQAGVNKRYISCSGNRNSSLAKERMDIINQTAEEFNRKIALQFGLEPDGISKTPDIYQALTKQYFPEQYQSIYAIEQVRPFYYTHPIESLLPAYYFLMEALLFDEIQQFTLTDPPPHIVRLGEHLSKKGQSQYTFQRHWDWAGIRLADVLGKLVGSPLQPV